jgi:hypothetical protein
MNQKSSGVSDDRTYRNWFHRDGLRRIPPCEVVKKARPHWPKPALLNEPTARCMRPSEWVGHQSLSIEPFSAEGLRAYGLVRRHRRAAERLTLDAVTVPESGLRRRWGWVALIDLGGGWLRQQLRQRLLQ